VVFLEGLVFHRGQMLLYYGTADSKIAVARAPMSSSLPIGVATHDATHDASTQVPPPPLVLPLAMTPAPPLVSGSGEQPGAGDLVAVPLFESTPRPSALAPIEVPSGELAIDLASAPMSRARGALLGLGLCIGVAGAHLLWSMACRRGKPRRNLLLLPCLPLQGKVDHEL
jgi:hypothetical protein